jgi:3-mercaptopyruvate sulfurtransferase SseA
MIVVMPMSFLLITNRPGTVAQGIKSEQHAGQEPSGYARPGRISSSVNVPASALVNPATHAYLPLDQLRALVKTVGATERE